MPTSTQRGISIGKWETRYLKGRYLSHRNKVAAAKPAIDSKPPQSHPHVQYKRKKGLNEQERQTLIMLENLRILNKTYEIMSGSDYNYYHQQTQCKGYEPNKTCPTMAGEKRINSSSSSSSSVSKPQVTKKASVGFHQEQRQVRQSQPITLIMKKNNHCPHSPYQMEDLNTFKMVPSGKIHGTILEDIKAGAAIKFPWNYNFYFERCKSLKSHDRFVVLKWFKLCISKFRTWESLLYSWGLDIVFHIFSHPFDFVSTLIQLGYEPIAPEPSGLFFKAPQYDNLQTQDYFLPSANQYVEYISHVDGYFGCYRGLIPSLCSYSVLYLVANSYNTYVTNTLEEIDSAHRLERRLQIAFDDLMNNNNNNNNHVPIQLNENGDLLLEEEDDEENSSDFTVFSRRTSIELLSMYTGLFISHPFHVMAVRSMAQFVGRETKYSSFFGSIAEIFMNEGVSGFYRGIADRIIGHTLYIIVSAGVTFGVKKVFNENVRERGFGSSLVGGFAAFLRQILASYYASPFFALGNIEIVQESGLAIGAPPFSNYVHYNLVSRFYFAIMRRLYKGPFTISDGKLKPSYPFGPKHPTGLGLGS